MSFDFRDLKPAHAAAQRELALAKR